MKNRAAAVQAAAAAAAAAREGTPNGKEWKAENWGLDCVTWFMRRVRTMSKGATVQAMKKPAPKAEQNCVARPCGGRGRVGWGEVRWGGVRWGVSGWGRVGRGDWGGWK